MSERWQRLKNWWDALGRRKGEIKCDVCGEWGTPNPNYLGVQTFVHFSKYTGGAYMHIEHVVRHVIYKRRHGIPL